MTLTFRNKVINFGFSVKSRYIILYNHIIFFLSSAICIGYLLYILYIKIIKEFSGNERSE